MPEAKGQDASPTSRRRLGEILCDQQLMTAEQLAAAVAAQRTSGAGRLGEMLLRNSLIKKTALIAAIEELVGVPYLDPQSVTPEPDALKLVPRAVARRTCCLPIAVVARRLQVVAAEPQDLAAMHEIRFASGMEVSAQFAFREEILTAIERVYRDAEQNAPVPETRADIPNDSEVEFVGSIRARAARDESVAELVHSNTPAVRVVSAVIAAAARRGASDIHFEQAPLGINVRVRVDGVLCPLTHVHAGLRNSLVSRLKILADLDISERRIPQDGRFMVRVGGRALDVRVSTLPTQFGEKIVLRLLDPSGPAARLDDLGFSPEQLAQITSVLALPQGMLLVCGPTGSGKSTTLYAALTRLRNSAINVTTVEDPVEYMIEGANQVQVNVKAGRTFAGCLRSILRQDPNVVMVGEIRDAETAEIALQAAQTGHLVLSTIHTNDAVSAIGRLRDLQAAPFMIASSLTAVISQRLVRRLCRCRREACLAPDMQAQLAAVGVPHFDQPVSVPGACPACDQTGYKGRVAVYEFLRIDDNLRPAIVAGAPDDEIRAIAEEHGMRRMQEDALAKVRAGVTTVEEVLRVVPFERKRQAAVCTSCGAAVVHNFVFCPYCAAALGESGPRREAVSRAPVLELVGVGV